MAEYIERDALLKEMHGLHTLPFFKGHMTDEDVMFKTMVSVVEEQPIADVVPVVRCCECKYWEKGKDYEPYCNHYGNMMTDTQADDYCSYGERRC